MAIDESNWGEFAAVILETEAAHWQGEYDALMNKYGVGGPKKVMAAWKLGATMLARRAEQYRQDDVRLTHAITPVAAHPVATSGTSNGSLFWSNPHNAAPPTTESESPEWAEYQAWVKAGRPVPIALLAAHPEVESK